MTVVVGRLVIAHARSKLEQAAELAAQLRLEGFDAVLLAVTVGFIRALSHAGPDVVVISYVTGSLDVPRLCRDLSVATDWRLVVVIWNAGGRDSDLDDDFVVEVLDSGADAVISRLAPPELLAARLRAAMRTRAEPSASCGESYQGPSSRDAFDTPSVASSGPRSGPRASGPRKRRPVQQQAPGTG